MDRLKYNETNVLLNPFDTTETHTHTHAHTHTHTHTHTHILSTYRCVKVPNLSC